MKIKNQKGQVILVLLLIMTVALAVGLSVVQRSVNDVSTSTKVEESARAFSAAEAGIERALINGSPNFSFPENNAQVSVQGFDIPDSNINALEIPVVSIDKPAHLWLTNPTSPYTVANQFGGGSGGDLYVYWGDPNPAITPIPALELTLVRAPGGVLEVKKYFFDSVATRRLGGLGNAFTDPDANTLFSGPCPSKQVITHDSSTGGGRLFANCTRLTVLGNPILLRGRLIYTDTDTHPMAFKPVNAGNLLPAQGKFFVSTGTSGETKRTVTLKKLNNVLPFFFDYVLFSIDDINK